VADRKPPLPEVDDWQDDPGDWEEEVPAPESIAPEPYGPIPDPVRTYAAGAAADRAASRDAPSERDLRGAVASYLRGPTFNFADRMAGLQAEQRAAIANMSRGAEEQQNLDAAYLQGRNGFRQMEGEFMEAHPAEAFGLTALGSLAAPNPSGAAPAFTTRAAGAAASGALAGAGAADEPEDMLRMAAFGAPLGVAGQAGGELLGLAAGMMGQGARRLGDAVRGAAGRAAPRRALAASGYIQKDLKPLMRRDPERAVAMGQALLDEPGVIRPGRTVADVAEGLEPAVQKYGKEMEDILRHADASGAKFDMEPFLSKVETEILAPIRGDPVVAREISELDRIVTGYRNLAQAKGGLSFAEANALKSRLQRMAINWGNFFSDSSPSENAQQFKVHLQNLFLNSIDEQIGDATTPELADAFRHAKRQYGTMVDALDKASQGRARMEGNKQFSLTDYLAALSGVAGSAASGDAAPLASGVGLALGNKLFRERGASTLATGLNALSKTSGPDWLDDLARTDPEAFGKLGAYLGSGASRTPEAMSMAHWELGQNDPEYQERMKRLGQENSQ
jgi:hypothetical protein